MGGRGFTEWWFGHLRATLLALCELNALKKVTRRFEGALSRIALAGFVNQIVPVKYVSWWSALLFFAVNNRV